MVEEREAGGGKGLVGTMAKKALAPLIHTAVTAATAYVTRKAIQVWREKVQPKVEEKGGGRAVARDTLETAAEKVGGPASDKITALAEKVGVEDSPQRSRSTGSNRSSDAGREAERRRRQQRRNERRKALEQSGSS